MMWWGNLRRRFPLTFLSVTLWTHLHSDCLKRTQIRFPCTISSPALTLIPPGANRIVKSPLSSPVFVIFISSFTSSIYEKQNAPAVKPDDESYIDEYNESSEDDNDDSLDEQFGSRNQVLEQNVATMLDILRESGSSRLQVKNKLEQCSVTASSELVAVVVSRVRNDWEAAFTFFLWAAKQPDYAHSLREYHLMISILAKMRKFDTAWALINEMRQVGTGQALVTPQTLLIMIRRYSAIHDVGKAINTFYAHKLFKFDVRMEEFHNLLSALCRYKNVKDAEHLLLCNQNVFPFNTKSFNIILNGWCNIIGNPREAKRIWREMDERGVGRDVISYTSIISCFSKASNVREVLKLFNQMKTLDIAPDRKVYNAVIHALAKGRLVKDARNLLKAMEENGVTPNAVTYNSLIKPLCKARQFDEAQEVFHEMLERGLSPTIRTYHAFFHILRSGEEVFSFLEKMNKVGCYPNNDTYVMLIRKFSRWRQLDDVLKLWSEMSKNGGGPDRSSYIALIHGLFLNGKLEEAYKYYEEMKEKRFLPEPKLDDMLQTWVSSKQIANYQMIDSKDTHLDLNQSGNKSKVTSMKSVKERDKLQQPETRRVVRERGFSLWEC